MNKKKKSNSVKCIDKENFLIMMKSLSKEELNNIIETKGKEPKLVTPIVYIK